MQLTWYCRLLRGIYLVVVRGLILVLFHVIKVGRAECPGQCTAYEGKEKSSSEIHCPRPLSHYTAAGTSSGATHRSHQKASGQIAKRSTSNDNIEDFNPFNKGVGNKVSQSFSCTFMLVLFTTHKACLDALRPFFFHSFVVEGGRK